MHLRPPRPGSLNTFDADSATAQRMIEAATSLLASLSSDQRSKVLFTLDSDERLKWDYRPVPREGISLREMDGSQQKLVFALLASGLSPDAQIKALSIMSLEKVLAEIEGAAGRHDRDPDLYYVTLFGVPSDKDAWGWRIEGHHVSLNFLIVEGKWVAPTPNFLGANPAKVLSGPRVGLRILAAEEDLARRLVTALGSDQRRRAWINAEAPEDIVTRWDPRVKLDSPVGLPLSEMLEDQGRSMMHLVEQYLSRMPEDVADRQMEQIQKEGVESIHFAWAGSEEPGKPHYYRLHGPSFLVEYDNTQDNANHIHTVWRNIRNDWGEDLLKGHYNSPAHQQ